LKLPAGSYALSFTSVAGFNTPTSVIITNTPGGPPVTQSISTRVAITAGVTTQVTANFVSLGSLRVETSPAVPSTIYSNGNSMDEWGMWADMEAGTYTISFRPIAGFTTPPPLAVTVVAGATKHVVGNFSSGTTTVVVP
jgi:hypothetical protein